MQQLIVKIATSTTHGLGVHASRNIARDETVLEEQPIAFTSYASRIDGDYYLYTPVWRLVDKVAAIPELLAWLTEGSELQPMEHSALKWEERDNKVMRSLAKKHTMDKKALYNLYAVIASVNMACMDGSIAIYRTSSYLNHACDPNCQVIPAQSGIGTIRLKASRDIKADEEITIGFSALSEGTFGAEIVQMIVEELHGFKCRCPVHTSL